MRVGEESSWNTHSASGDQARREGAVKCEYHPTLSVNALSLVSLCVSLVCDVSVSGFLPMHYESSNN